MALPMSPKRPQVSRATTTWPLTVALPMRRLMELSQARVVGRAAPSHYSIMGYILEPTVLVAETAPAITERMHDDGVDAAALVPA